MTTCTSRATEGASHTARKADEHKKHHRNSDESDGLLPANPVAIDLTTDKQTETDAKATEDPADLLPRHRLSVKQMMGTFRKQRALNNEVTVESDRVIERLVDACGQGSLLAAIHAMPDESE